MADFDMWGPAASGARLVDFDRLKGAKQLGEIAMQPYELENLKAQAEQRRMQTQVLEQERDALKQKAAQEAQFSELLKNAQGENAQAVNVLDKVDDLAARAAEAGLITKSLEIMGKTSGIRATKAREAASIASAEDRLYQTEKRRLDTLLGMMGDENGQLAIKSPEEWAAVNQLYSQTMKEPSPFSQIPFEQVPQLYQGAISAKDRLELKRRGERDEQRKAFENARLGQHNSAQRVREAAKRLREQREARLAKGGGNEKVAPRASKEDVEQATRLIDSDELGMDKENKREAAYSVAATAMRMMQQNKALDRDTALRRAYQQAKDAGEFETRSGILGFGKETKFVKGKEIVPVPLPSDRSKWKIGDWYTSPNGTVGQWTGKGFKPGNPARGAIRGAAPSGGGVPDDTDDDEGEE